MQKKLLLCICAVCIQLLLCCCFAQEGTDCISTATEQYSIGQFYECISNLNQCLNTKRFNNFDQRLRANKILAMCYLATDQNSSADSVIVTLLSMQPDFEPDLLTDPDRFIKAVEHVKSSMERNTISSVSKRPEDIRLAPATTMVITQEQIMQRGYNDLTDILKDIPGFDITVSYGQLYAHIYQRGLRTNNNDKTLLLIDGVEDNDLWSNYADISQQYPITNIKRVEVIYGPASTMYGPNAFSSVINIITKNANDFIKKDRSVGFQVSTGYGSYNTKYIDASAGYKNNVYSLSVTGRLYYSDRPDLSSQASWDYAPSYIENIDNNQYANKLKLKDVNFSYLTSIGITPSGRNPYLSPDSLLIIHKQDNGDYRINITDSAIRLAKKLDAAYYTSPAYAAFKNSAQDFYLSAKMNIGGFSLGVYSWSKNEGSGTYYVDQAASVRGTRWKPQHNAVYVNYNRVINNQMDFSVSTNYEVHTINEGSRETMAIKGYYNGYLEVADLVNGNLPSEGITTYYYEQSNRFRSEIRFAYTQSKYFNIVSGIELRSSLLQGYLLSDTTPHAQDNGYLPDSLKGGNIFQETDIGIYTQGVYRTKYGLGFTAGVRLDHNSLRNNLGLGYTVSPRLVIDYSINKNWIIKAIYSAGIQNINMKVRSNNPNSIPNPNLRPERIYNYEFSSAYTFSKHISTDIDFYYSAVRDVVGGIIVTVDGKNHQQIQNIGKFKIFGIQANAYYNSKHFQAALNYSYTNPKQVKGTFNDSTVDNNTYTIADIAAHKANAIVNYNFLKHYNLNFRANYVGNKKAGANTTVPGNPIQLFKGYWIGNASVSIKDIARLNGLIVQFNCNNLFNKMYFSPGTRNATGSFAPDEILQMRRNYSIKIYYDL